MKIKMSKKAMTRANNKSVISVKQLFQQSDLTIH